MDASDPECWDEMLAMRDDWDQYGANHRRPLAIARARQVYGELPVKPHSAAAECVAWQRGVGDASTLAVGLLGGAANLAVAGWQWRDERRRRGVR